MFSGDTMGKRTLAGFCFAAAMGLVLEACGDSKVREENEQLKAHVLQLQKDTGDLGNRVDVLTKENADLAAQIDQMKKRLAARKSAKPKARSKTPQRRNSPQN
jgi:regulator of replication initiation timing